MGRAALGEYRVGAPLPFEDLRFARGSNPMTTTDTATPTDGAVTSGAARGGAGHWSLTSFFAQGWLLAPPHPLRS